MERQRAFPAVRHGPSQHAQLRSFIRYRNRKSYIWPQAYNSNFANRNNYTLLPKAVNELPQNSRRSRLKTQEPREESATRMLISPALPHVTGMPRRRRSNHPIPFSYPSLTAHHNSETLNHQARSDDLQRPALLYYVLQAATDSQIRLSG